MPKELSMAIIAKAGAVPYRRLPTGQIEILVISSPHRTDHWLFPMGHIDPGETPQETARRETQEEAGIIADPGPHIGQLVFTKSLGDEHRVDYYLAEYCGDTDWPESKQRQRQWLALEEAEATVAPDFHKFITTAREILI